jgi:hypothetical protein
MTIKTITTATIFTSAALIVLSSFNTVHAVDFGADIKTTIKAERQELTGEKKQAVQNLREQFKQIIASRVGDLKKMFGEQAVLRSALVTAKNGSTLTVTDDGKTYSVKVTDATKIRRRYFGKSNAGDLETGHLLNIVGTFTDENKNTVNAKLIRDLSIMKRHGVFIGNVTQINGNTITLDTVNRGTFTVTMNSASEVVNRRMENMPLSDVKSGHRIRIKGLWDKVNKTVTEVSQLKDYSVPTPVKGEDNGDPEEKKRKTTPTVTPAVSPTVKPTSTVTPTPSVSPKPSSTPTVTPTPTT